MSGMDMSMTLTSSKGLDNVLSAAGDRAWHELGAAMRVEAELIMTAAKEITPVLTGAMRGSGNVQGPDMSGDKITVALGFGGPSVDYVIKQHEDLNLYHDDGEAKFLEKPFLAAVNGMQARIAQRIRTHLEMGL